MSDLLPTEAYAVLTPSLLFKSPFLNEGSNQSKSKFFIGSRRNGIYVENVNLLIKFWAVEMYIEFYLGYLRLCIS